MTTDDTVDVPGAPPIPNLTFRRFRGVADYPAIASVFDAPIEKIPWIWEPQRGFDPYQHLLLVIVDNEVVGVSRQLWLSLRDGTQVYGHISHIQSSWREQRLEHILLRYNERCLWELAIAQRRSGQIPGQASCVFTYLASVLDSQSDLEAFLRNEGYEPVRSSFDMVRSTLEDLPEAPLPMGLEVRPVHPDQYRTIWEARKEAFQDTFGSTPPTEEEYQVWLSFPHFDAHLWQVAWDGDQVAGMVLSFINAEENVAHRRLRGYTENIGVRQPWRRRGMARSLLVRSLQVLKDAGMNEAGLTVDTENQNGALRLYKSVGFQVVRRKSTYAKPFTP